MNYLSDLGGSSGWNVTAASSLAAGLTEKVSALAEQAVEAIKEEYKFTYEDFGLKIVRVRADLLAVEFPRPNRMSYLAMRLKNEYEDEYLIVNLSGRPYDTSKFKGPVMDIVMSGSVPPLEVLLRLCLSAHRWLNQHGRKRSLVLHGNDDHPDSRREAEASFQRVALFLTCYLGWANSTGSWDVGLAEVVETLQLGSELLPSQMRYLRYFESQRRAAATASGAALAAAPTGGPELAATKRRALDAPMKLSKLVLVSLGGDGFDWHVEVLHLGTRVFKAAFLDPDVATSAFTVDVACAGDICIKAVRRRRRKETQGGASQEEETMMELCFHTAFLADGFTRFEAQDLDVLQRCDEAAAAADAATSEWAVDVCLEQLPTSTAHFHSASEEAFKAESAGASAALVAAVAKEPLKSGSPAKSTTKAAESRHPVETVEESSGPTVFDIGGDDDSGDDDDDFWLATRAGADTEALSSSAKPVFAPDDIDAFFKDL
eukprot:TRINITY_DN62198_c0_g1_i1.p1 TRINITY_DN62198_c0_g1~~TRINITY_DN62198_c0_g1_i1.p1  ORF type:complete len:489 (-),score=92.09 TRINITY_DN62198_c0_g1_i1:154-1620(-)